jgi:hypothetical protein
LQGEPPFDLFALRPCFAIFTGIAMSGQITANRIPRAMLLKRGDDEEPVF